ncbi:MAG: alpha/beta hydrolase [Candidatus Eiseniibacteriota bacterium]
MSGTPAGATRLLALTLEGPAGALEALLQERAGESPARIAVVCHPHPLYGGTLNNKVVHRVASTLHGLGAAVLRFNFRGVGKSAGHYDQGRGELEDARAAFDWLVKRHPGAHRWMAGFSFGSWIAARLAAEERAIERLILVAPPVRSSSFEVLHTLSTPKLVLQGDHDDMCPPDALEQEWPKWAEPRELIVIPGANHFFDRQLGDLSAALTRALPAP